MFLWSSNRWRKASQTKKRQCPSCQKVSKQFNWYCVLNTYKRHGHEPKGETKCGHFLDPPDLRTTDPIPERELSPLSNCIMRLLLHAVCVGVASSNDKVWVNIYLSTCFIIDTSLLQVACEELSKAVVQNQPVPPKQILNFFWHHLEKDFQTLTRATQQSFDDCVLFLHTLIHYILSTKHDNIGTKQT